MLCLQGVLERNCKWKWFSFLVLACLPGTNFCSTGSLPGVQFLQCTQLLQHRFLQHMWLWLFQLLARLPWDPAPAPPMASPALASCCTHSCSRTQQSVVSPGTPLGWFYSLASEPLSPKPTVQISSKFHQHGTIETSLPFAKPQPSPLQQSLDLSLCGASSSSTLILVLG